MADGNSSKVTKAFEVVASIKADLTGFKKGVKEMIQDIKGLSGQAGNIKLGEGLDLKTGEGKGSFSGGSAEVENLGSYLEKLGSSIQEIASKLEETANNITNSGSIKNTSGLEGINNDIKKIISEVENKFKTGGTDKGKDVEDLQSQLKNISGEIEKKISGFGKDSKIEKSNINSGEFKNFSSQLKGIGQSMKQVADSLKKGIGNKNTFNASDIDLGDTQKKSVRDKILEMKESVKQFRENPKEFISNRISSMKEGVKNTFSPENMKNGIQGMVQRMRGFNQQMEVARNHGNNFTNLFSRGIPDGIRKAESALDKFGNALKVMFTMYAGKKLFDFTLGQGMEFEKYQVSFESIYKGDKEKAKAKMEQLTKYADTTPFEIPDVMQAGSILGSVGMNNDKWIKMAGDLASFNVEKGTTIQDTSRMLTNLYTGNYGLAREQLREYKIQDTDLAKHGVRFSNSGEFKSDADTIRRAVEEIIKEKAGGKTQALGQTASGMLSTIKDTLMGVGRDTSSKLFDDYKSSIKEVLDLLKELGRNGQLKAFAYSIANALKPAIDGFKNLIVWIGKCVQSGKSLTFFAYVSTAFRVLGIIIKSIITIITNLINILKQISSVLSKLSGSTRSASSALYQLLTAFIAVKLAMIAFRNQAMITGFIVGLIKLFKLLKSAIMGTESAVQILRLAFKALVTGNWVGVLITIVSTLLFLVMQLQVVKDAIGGFLNKIGLGSLADILGLNGNNGNTIDDMIDQAKKQMDDDAKKAMDDANKQVDPGKDPNIDDDPYKDHGMDLKNQLNTAIDDLDISIRKQELINQGNLQGLSLKGKDIDSAPYLVEDRTGLKELLARYQEGMAQMKDIMAKATNAEDKDTRVQANLKYLEYQVKANELLTQIANNTDDLKNAIQMIDLRNNKVDLQKDINMQELEIDKGTRPDTYAYWMQNREWLKKQMEDYRNAYQRIKSLVPTLNGEEKIQAEIKALEYQKKANELLLEIKKNTDPRNGTFNLPSDIRSYSLFEDRQKNGKSGMVVSGNNFLIQVKELVKQEQIQDLMDRIQEAIYERTASDVRR